jgi:uncharacterized protein YraI
MKGFTVVAFVLLLAVSAAAEPATVVSKLNLRTGPGPAFGIIAVMPPGLKLDVQKCDDEWCRVKLGGQIGYASQDFLKIGGDSYASAAPRAAPVPLEAKPTLTGPRVWQWHDANWRNEHWRRFDWHNRMRH